MIRIHVLTVIGLLGLLLQDVIGIDDENYRYLSYQQIYEQAETLSRFNKDILRFHDPEIEFNETSLPKTKCTGSSTSVDGVCKHFYLEVTNFENPNYRANPQVLLVGGFHGDEQIGPNTLSYLLEYLVLNKRDNALIQQLLDERLIVIVPTVNPSGYSDNRREEQQVNRSSVDINRDFPYNNDKCFKTAASRILLRLFQKYLFQTGITFHGGMYALSYPWGSTNHYSQSTQLTPDHALFDLIAGYMNRSAPGVFRLGISNYPVGTLNKVIYPADGTLEDWAYSGAEDQAANKKCADFEHTIPNDNLRTLFYLVEVSEPKKPLETLLGSRSGILNTKDHGYGFIARNINLALANIESAAPMIRLSHENLGGRRLRLRWQLYGCQHVDRTQLFYRSEKQERKDALRTGNELSADQAAIESLPRYLEEQEFLLQQPRSFQGQGRLDNPEFYFEETLSFDLETSLSIYITAQCDSPFLTGQMRSHIAQSRTRQNYSLSTSSNYSARQTNLTVRLFRDIPVTEQSSSPVNSLNSSGQETRSSSFTVREVLTVVIMVFLLCLLVALLVYRLFYRPKYLELVEHLEKEKRKYEAG